MVLPVAPGQSVVDAAIAADVPLRFDCTTGNCGTCIAHCTGGDVDTEICAVVSEVEAAGGMVATCLTRLRADVTLELDYPLAPLPSPPQRHAARLASLDRVSATVSRLNIELVAPDDFRFQPGQYLRLRAPGLKVARAYSIASTMAELPLVELLIRHVPGGQMAGWLEERAQPGDRLALHGPLGSFGLDDRHRRQVFIAGGTGLAPVLAMIRTRPKDTTMLLCFGCTLAEDLFYEAELRALAVTTPGLEIRLAVMGGARGAVRSGTAVGLLRDADLIGAAGYYLCGPPPMVEAARALLTARGVPARAIRSERFQPGG